nr:hypothetical protein [Mimivirus sp.]
MNTNNMVFKFLVLTVEVVLLIISFWLSYWSTSQLNIVDIVNETIVDYIIPIKSLTVILSVFHIVISSYIPENSSSHIYVSLALILKESWTNLAITTVVIYLLTEKISFIKNNAQEIVQFIAKTIGRISIYCLLAIMIYVSFVFYIFHINNKSNDGTVASTIIHYHSIFVSMPLLYRLLNILGINIYIWLVIDFVKFIADTKLHYNQD